LLSSSLSEGREVVKYHTCYAHRNQHKHCSRTENIGSWKHGCVSVPTFPFSLLFSVWDIEFHFSPHGRSLLCTFSLGNKQKRGFRSSLCLTGIIYFPWHVPVSWSDLYSCFRWVHQFQMLSFALRITVRARMQLRLESLWWHSS
jgi:hypothetical protein